MLRSNRALFRRHFAVVATRSYYCLSRAVQKNVGVFAEIAQMQCAPAVQCRDYSSSSPCLFSISWNTSSGGDSSFRPRRRPNPGYRSKIPSKKKSNKTKGPLDPFTIENPLGTLAPLDFDKDHEEVDLASSVEDRRLGLLSDAIRHLNDQKEQDLESQLRVMDYFASAPGSAEEWIGERRALAQQQNTLEERMEFLKQADHLIDEERIRSMELFDSDDEDDEQAPDEKSKQTEMDEALRTGLEPNKDGLRAPNQIAHGEWGEMIVHTDRVAKVWRGGRIFSYRCLVIGGNGRGCAGFGFGKGETPEDALAAACRHCKRNVFFIDGIKKAYLTRHLVGKHNSCRVKIYANDTGLKGNPTIMNILGYFGITFATAKAHGNRNPYNVVRAAFKAIATHESMEEIAMKRGKRLITVERARRFQV